MNNFSEHVAQLFHLLFSSVHSCILSTVSLLKAAAHLILSAAIGSEGKSKAATTEPPFQIKFPDCSLLTVLWLSLLSSPTAHELGSFQIKMKQRIQSEKAANASQLLMSIQFNRTDKRQSGAEFKLPYSADGESSALCHVLHRPALLESPTCWCSQRHRTILAAQQHLLT